MKKKLLTFAILLFSVCCFSTNSFSQIVPGGSDDGTGGGIGTDPGGTAGGGTVGGTSCPLNYAFKRNNGNGWGVCHGDAQIRVVFTPLPSANNVPQLIGIYYQGAKLTNVITPVNGDIIDKNKPYISYCLIGSLPERNNGNPKANIPPAVKLTLEFKYADGTVCRTDNEVTSN